MSVKWSKKIHFPLKCSERIKSIPNIGVCYPVNRMQHSKTKSMWLMIGQLMFMCTVYTVICIIAILSVGTHTLGRAIVLLTQLKTLYGVT